MKKTIGILSMVLAGSLAFAQEYRTPVSAQKIHFVLHNCAVSVEGYDGNELVVNTRDYEAPPKQAEGLRSLYSSGTDNSGLGLSVSEVGDELTILKVGRNDADYEFKVPKGISLIVEEVNYSGDDMVFRNLSGDLEIRTTSSDVVLEGVTGPIVANSVSGNITVVFSEVNQQKPTSITVVSGDADITLPAQTPANLKLASVSGEVYTNFDISLRGGDEEKGMKRLGMGHPIEGTINNGGVALQVKTVSGDIFLRKAE